MKILKKTLIGIGVLAMLGGLHGCKEKDMSMKMNEPRNIRGVVSYKRSFNDLNDTHLAAARAIGINPIDNREAAEMMTRSLELVATCETYRLDSLTHSIPYLVPKAHTLLETLAAGFQDSLTSKGLNPYKMIVTSVLRTNDDIKRLQRGNVNATKKSAHRFGTTFDVSYKRFEQVPDPDGRPMQEVGTDTLKMVLAECLRDLKQAGSCYVKYELKQGCFHITAR